MLLASISGDGCRGVYVPLAALEEGDALVGVSCLLWLLVT